MYAELRAAVLNTGVAAVLRRSGWFEPNAIDAQRGHTLMLPYSVRKLELRVAYAAQRLLGDHGWRKN